MQPILPNCFCRSFCTSSPLIWTIYFLLMLNVSQMVSSVCCILFEVQIDLVFNFYPNTIVFHSREILFDVLPFLLDLKSKYNAQIYVTAVQPPIINIVTDGTVYTFPQDRFNLYHALLMFFHFYKTLDGNIR